MLTRPTSSRSQPVTSRPPSLASPPSCRDHPATVPLASASLSSFFLLSARPRGQFDTGPLRRSAGHHPPAPPQSATMTRSDRCCRVDSAPCPRAWPIGLWPGSPPQSDPIGPFAATPKLDTSPKWHHVAGAGSGRGHTSLVPAGQRQPSGPESRQRPLRCSSALRYRGKTCIMTIPSAGTPDRSATMTRTRTFPKQPHPGVDGVERPSPGRNCCASSTAFRPTSSEQASVSFQQPWRHRSEVRRPHDSPAGAAARLGFEVDAAVTTFEVRRPGKQR